VSLGPVTVLQKRRMDELKAQTPENVRTDLRCPDCGGLLVLRVGRYGRFYGCPKFPKCWGSWSSDDNGNPVGQPTGKINKERRKQKQAERARYLLKKLAAEHSYLKIAQEALQNVDRMDIQTSQIVLGILQGSIPTNRWERLTSEIF
jgi:ssDNA-binding Zn-finger/Zn-ribbon topoisomerase 1